MTKLTDQEFKNEFLEFKDEILEFKEQTLTRLTALEVKVERVPEMEKDISEIKVTQSKILGILEGRESATARTRANIALWIAAGVALFGEAGSKILSLFR